MKHLLRNPLLAVAGLLAFVSVAIVIGYLQTGGAPKPVVSQGGPKIASFHLVDQNGNAVTEKDVIGRPAALLFGFTYCPDVCPTMLAALTGSLSKLGTDADQLGVYFVSVDPERDTTSVLKTYLAAFDPRIRGLTGSPEQIGILAKSLGIYHAKVDTGSGRYSVDHSALIVLLDDHGQFFGTIAFDESADTAVAKLKRLANEGKR